MKLRLDVMERLVLLGLLPAEGTFANLKLLRIAKEQLSFDDKENKLLKFRIIGEGQEAKQTWDSHRFVRKSDGVELDGSPEFVQKMLAAKPEDFERVPVVLDKEIKIGEVVEQMVVKSLKELDGKEGLKEEHFSLYEKFIDKPTVPELVPSNK